MASTDINETDEYVRKIRENHANDQMTRGDLHIYAQSIGPKLVVFASSFPDACIVQCTYSEMFMTPLVNRIRYCGNGEMMPLIARGALAQCPQTPVINAHCDSTKPNCYVSDLFACDHAIITRSTHPRIVDEHITATFQLCSKVFDVLRVEPVRIGSIIGGKRAFVDRATFDARVAKTFVIRRGDGQTVADKAISVLFNGAGLRPYCIAGGCISKLIDPLANDEERARSDVDVFVYGDDQEKIISDLAREITAGTEHAIVVFRGVASIYRPGATKIQIVSSGFKSPDEIIKNFDFSHVMAYWSNNSVHITAMCAHSFATRQAYINEDTYATTPFRAIKSIMSGFIPIHSDGKNTTQFRKMVLMLGHEDTITAQIIDHIACAYHGTADQPISEFRARVSLVHCGTLAIVDANGITPTMNIARPKSDTDESVTRETDDQPFGVCTRVTPGHGKAVMIISTDGAVSVTETGSQESKTGGHSESETDDQTDGSPRAKPAGGIGSSMLIGHIINGYGPANVDVTEWDRTMDVSDEVLPKLSYGFHTAIIVAGMKASTEVAGTVVRAKGLSRFHNAQVIMSTDADIDKWIRIIDIIRRKFAGRELTIDTSRAYANKKVLSVFSSRNLSPDDFKRYERIRLSPHVQRDSSSAFTLVIQMLALH